MKAYASQKWGHEETDTHLPAAARQLRQIHDYQIPGTRRRLLLQCPCCGTCFLYTSDYTYLANGSEDEQWLERLPAP
jgi:uncharacterized C2H2 Zn-finger protein